MSYAIKQVTVPVELYTDFKVLSGFIKCPEGSRLLDAFNYNERTVKGDFIEFINTSDYIFGNANPERPPEYIRRSAVEMIAVSDNGLCRGICADRTMRAYPFVEKVQIPVNIQLHSFTLIGNMHLSQGQSVHELLNESKAFIPLTEVTIIFENHLYGNRPFVAVNKQHIIYSRQEALQQEQNIQTTA